MNSYQEKPGVLTRLFRLLVFGITAFLFIQLISLYLSWPKQAILGGASILLALVTNRCSKGRVVTLALMLISMTATFRYAWWRIHLLADYFTDPSNNRAGLDAAFLLILISAEAYTIVIMILGYMQTVWPLRRIPILLPLDESKWPHVDVLIPTYNEALSLVRYTALAANNIDYPPDKLHIYILDDGTREEFRQFALEAGVGYVTRKEHNHAKAGNINHALTTMGSPYVAIFDCDHVPTRSFLQMTLGWMLADPLLAMVQTPHHFYSPDPFERNLLQYKTIPNEAELFYGIVQDGNDFWNATFFCGSCALIRRSALDEVGGIATETVTEDAHTSLRMQKRGYNTAYINIPQAAGLATETLAAHVGQRIRWARGMIQIFRTDNPMFGGKLKFTQRLCYFNAMAHFLYAVPRLVFLGAPLVYLLLGRTIIPGYWVAILAYAFPHLILASLTNSRIQGRHRHSFWNEIYEAVLAPYILAPTLLAFINPKLGKFNVTDKGSTLATTHFDRQIATPTRWMLFLNFLGLLAVPYRLFIADPQHPGAVIMNLAWVIFNLVILGVAAAVANEQKQRRESVRIEARIKVLFTLPDGSQIDGMSNDMSVGGASIKVAEDAHFALGDSLKIAFPEIAGDEGAQIDATVMGLGKGEVRLAFLLPTIPEQETLTRALYSRADAWISSLESKELDRPLVSLGRVMVLSVYGIYEVLRSIFPSRSATSTDQKAQTLALFLAAFLFCAVGHAQRSTASAQTHAAQAAQAPGPGTSQAIPAASDNQRETEASVESQQQVLSLKDLGVSSAIEMRGPHSYYSVRFTLSHALVPRAATLRLVYKIDPSLDPHATSLRVNLNGAVIASLPPPPASEAKDGFVFSDVAVPDALLVRSNSFTFEFIGSGVMQREDEARAQILCRISQSSTLEVTGDRFRLGNDLSQLPLPVFDTDIETATTVPFVFLSKPDPMTLQAAGAVASWLGLQASSKPVRFAVVQGQIPPGNVILLSDDRSSLPASLLLPIGSGPLLALRNNPSDPYGTVLVLAGDNDEQLLSIARTVALTKSATATTKAQGLPLSGDAMQNADLPLPRERAKDDAPRWMSIEKAAPLASCEAQDTLQTDGSSPIPVYFHVPPDLFYGERENLEMHLNYRYDARPIAKGSALRIFVNGRLVNEVPLLPGTDIVDRERSILIPVSDIRPFGNTIRFSFDFIPSNREAQNAGATILSGEILCSSTLDLHGLSLWTRMPNLELLANAGFPFTQLADLSQTTIVLPAEPTAAEIALYLHLMGHFGAQTGYPVTRVTVAGPNVVISPSRDYLILGTIADQPAINSLDPLLPVTMDATGVHVKPAHGYASLVASAGTFFQTWWSRLLKRPFSVHLPSNDAGPPDALIEEIQSPASPDRSIVLIALRQDAVADPFAEVLLDRSQSGDIIGSVSLLRNLKFDSYAVSEQAYHVGSISWFAMMRIWFAQYFMPLLLVVTALSFLMARWVNGWLARHASERLKLAGTPLTSEEPREFGEKP
jgi:cellulose synthase (UDP-forming)